MTRWYVVHTKPRQEMLAQTHLHRQAFRTYLPLIAQTRRRRDRRVEVILPLFPRYLFIQVNLREQCTAAVRSTLGVTAMVRFGDQLLPVPDSVIAYLQASTDADTGLHRLHAPRFQKGDKVRVDRGPFAGLEGIYQAERGEDRFMILLDFLGRQTPVTLSSDALASRSAA